MRISSRQFAHFALGAYLLSPLILQPIFMGGRGWIEVLYFFNLFTAGLWIGLFYGLKVRPFTLHALAAPLYILTAVDLFLLFNFGNRLSSAYFGIVLTNYGEAAEFFSSYLRPVLVSSTILLFVYLAGLYKVRKLEARKNSRLSLVCAVLLLLTYSAQFANNYRNEGSVRIAALDVLGKELSAPMGSVFQGTLALILQLETGTVVEKRKHFSFQDVSAKAVSPNSIFVWIIGESSRPNNWGLMGYSRNTTPRLQALKDVVPLPDLLTNAPYTSDAVTSMLSLRSIQDWDSVVSERSIVSVFNQAGFMTYWLSAQEVDGWGGLIQHVAAEAKQRRYFDRALDSVLVDEFRRIVANKPVTEPLFVVLHTKGSHWRYDRRYPKEFEHFSSGTTTRDKLVDQYDNSILYTDWIVSEIIRTVEQANVDSAVVYESDHGQNLFDDNAQLFGHTIGNQYDLHAAALLWLSPSLKAKRERDYEHLQRHSRLPISMADLPHSYLDLAGIRVDGLDTSRSLFSTDYVQRDRWYRFHGKANREVK